MKKLNILIFLLVSLIGNSYAAILEKGLTDSKVKEFFGKLAKVQKDEILAKCKGDLGSIVNSLSESDLVDKCIKDARKNIDPLDNYIDPDTLVNYMEMFEGFNEDKKKHILNIEKHSFTRL